MSQFLALIAFVIVGSAVASLAVGSVLWLVKTQQDKRASAMEARHIRH
jgi:hypothetical protein